MFWLGLVSLIIMKNQNYKEVIIFKDVENKIRKKSKILFNHNSPSLHELSVLIDNSSRLTIVLWALDCAKIPLSKFEREYPSDHRPRIALKESFRWARGEIKMPIAKKHILETHAIAKEIDNEIYIAICHGIAQACSTVHTPTHGLGLPMYELTSIVMENDMKNYEEEVVSKIQFYVDKLVYWNHKSSEIDGPWASFLI